MDVAEVSGAAAVCVHVCRQVSLNQQLVLTFRLVDAACCLLAQVWLFSGGGGADLSPQPWCEDPDQ